MLSKQVDGEILLIQQKWHWIKKFTLPLSVHVQTLSHVFSPVMEEKKVGKNVNHFTSEEIVLICYGNVGYLLQPMS